MEKSPTLFAEKVYYSIEDDFLIKSMANYRIEYQSNNDLYFVDIVDDSLIYINPPYETEIKDLLHFTLMDIHQTLEKIYIYRQNSGNYASIDYASSYNFICNLIDFIKSVDHTYKVKNILLSYTINVIFLHGDYEFELDRMFISYLFYICLKSFNIFIDETFYFIRDLHETRLPRSLRKMMRDMEKELKDIDSYFSGKELFQIYMMTNQLKKVSKMMKR